jgi:hypothetical protein
LLAFFASFLGFSFSLADDAVVFVLCVLELFFEISFELLDFVENRRFDRRSLLLHREGTTRYFYVFGFLSSNLPERVLAPEPRARGVVMCGGVVEDVVVGVGAIGDVWRRMGAELLFGEVDDVVGVVNRDNVDKMMVERVRVFL